MKKRDVIGTIFILGVLITGMCIVLINCIVFFFSLKGTTFGQIGNWFIQNTSPSFTWQQYLPRSEERYPILFKYKKTMSGIDKYDYFIFYLEEDVENFCTTGFPMCKEVKTLVDKYKEYILRNNSVNINGKTNYEYAKEAAECVNEFGEWCRDNSIDFVYVNLPSLDRINAMSEYGNRDYDIQALKKADLFCQMMKDKDINFININDEEGIVNNARLDVTAHWFCNDALKSTRILADRLKIMIDDYPYVEGLYDDENYIDNIDENISQRIKSEYGYDYSCLVPLKKGSYNLVQERGFDEVELTGSFDNVFVRAIGEQNVLSDTNQPIAYHNLWTIDGGTLNIVTNNTIDDKYKILILGDSYTWPMTSYLSQNVKWISAIHPGSFYGDVKTYIYTYQPDLIIWLYNENQVNKDKPRIYGWVNK